MIAALATTAAVALASAFVPAIPIEAYLVAAIATTGTDPVALGVAAGLGQTAGKLHPYVGGDVRCRLLRRAIDSLHCHRARPPIGHELRSSRQRLAEPRP
jgi:membrane protein YqaA with SNARE-associated domain